MARPRLRRSGRVGSSSCISSDTRYNTNAKAADLEICFFFSPPPISVHARLSRNSGVHLDKVKNSNLRLTKVQVLATRSCKDWTSGDQKRQSMLLVGNERRLLSRAGRYESGIVAD